MLFTEYEQAVREAFFREFFGLKKIVDEIEDSIRLYNRYTRLGRSSLLFGISLFFQKDNSVMICRMNTDLGSI